MPANPNNRWNAFLDELFRRYNDTIPHAVKAVENLLRSIIVSCVFGILFSIISFNFLPILVLGGYSILCWFIIHSGIMNGVNEEQINDAIVGDMFKVQEVNIEISLSGITLISLQIAPIEFANKTFLPKYPNEELRFILVVVFPTPPF